MRRIALYLILYLCFATFLSAQDMVFNGESLAAALSVLRDRQNTYTIHFIANDLEQLPVTARLQNVSVPKAVKRLCLGQPVKVKIKGKQIFIQYDKSYKAHTILLKGSICDSKTRDQLLGATVELLDADSVRIDSVSGSTTHWGYYGGKRIDWETSDFSVSVPAVPAHYIFRITREDYRTVCYHYVLDRVGRREVVRKLPPFYIHKELTTLGEVTVTASRIRLYYKGDTLIYSADALQLAEGTMLDGLLRRLPGMEIKSDGRIYHNGKFVDDLLLNGKDFFRGDRKLMLENLPAYTVKNVAVYDKQTAENEWLGRKDESTQHYVVDVQLKKEYLVGWMANIEAGTGIRQDEMPYLARLFLMRHTDHSRLAVAGNANNLTDDSRQMFYEEGGWNRGAADALRRSERASVDLSVENSKKTWEYTGNIDALHTTDKLVSRTTMQTFLLGGDTYEYAFVKARNEDWQLDLYNMLTFEGKQLRVSVVPTFSYHHFRNTSEGTSGLFSAPVADVSRQLLNDIFSPTSLRHNLRDTLINRSRNESLGIGHDLNAEAAMYGTWKVKGTNDAFRLDLSGKYDEHARQSFSRQNVEYTQNPNLFRHQYSDLPPCRKFELRGRLIYDLLLGYGYRSLQFTYSFTHRNEREKESIYRLDQLAGADSAFARPIDQLPSASMYQQVIDRKNSYLNHYLEYSHYAEINFRYGFGKKDWGQLYLDSHFHGLLNQQKNDYERGSIDTTLHRLSSTFEFHVKPWLSTKKGHHAGLSIDVRNEAPDLLNEAAVTDDTDPMNIRIGNPSLRYALRTEATLDGNLYSLDKSMHNRLDFNYGFTHNAIGMSQTYNRQTGKRAYRPENVNGNWDTYARHTIDYSFGDGKKHSARMVTQFSYRNSVDLMEEENVSQLNKSTVRTATLSFSPKVSLSLGKHTLNLSSDVSWNRYSSDRNTFQNISAWQYRIGADAIIHLPWQFDLTTDLTLYGRTGYNDAALNTSDLVWNARLSRSILRGNLLVIVDGFDILGQLSNVTRTVNAQGRTETYTNVLPRYALLHIVYKFKKLPKKK